MITEKDLQEAIAECEGQRNPNANTCIKLAAFYTIRRELFGSPEPYQEPQERIHGYSGSMPEPVYDSGTEFSEAIKDADIYEILPLIDELISTIEVLNPRLYAGFIRKLTER